MKVILLAIMLGLYGLVYAQDLEGKIVAIVGSQVLTNIDLEDRLALMIKLNDIDIAKASEAEMNYIKKNIVQTLIDEKIKNIYAADIGVFVNHQETQDYVGNLRQNPHLGKKINAILENEALKDEFFKQVTSEIRWYKIVNGALASKVDISEDELKQYQKQLEKGGFEASSLNNQDETKNMLISSKLDNLAKSYFNKLKSNYYIELKI